MQNRIFHKLEENTPIKLKKIQIMAIDVYIEISK